MIVRRFLLWARTASAADRADGIAALSRAYLYSDLGDAERHDALTAFAAALDDPSPLVRRAMADAFGGSPDAPRHIVTALAGDQPDIAALVLGRSPLFCDWDLVDAAATGCAAIRQAIAGRPLVSSAVAAALVEVGDAGVAAALAANPGAVFAETTFLRVIARFGEDGAVREALTGRRDLPVAARQALTAAAAKALSSFTIGLGWMQAERGARIAREANERATVALASSADAAALVDHLTDTDQLTPALLLRGLMSGADAFVEAALARLSGFSPQRVRALVADRRTSGFAGFYRRTGLPATLEPVLRNALAARRSMAGAAEGGLDLALIRATIARCEAERVEGRAMTALRRLEAEAAREAAVQAADRLADQAALATVLAHAPEMILLPAIADGFADETGQPDEDVLMLEDPVEVGDAPVPIDLDAFARALEPDASELLPALPPEVPEVLLPMDAPVDGDAYAAFEIRIDPDERRVA